MNEPFNPADLDYLPPGDPSDILEVRRYGALVRTALLGRAAMRNVPHYVAPVEAQP